MIDCKADSRLELRRSAMIAAAKTLFIENGFDRTNLGDVVASAGGSLATLYKLFGNKEGLLLAVITELIQSDEMTIQQCAALGLGPEQTLRTLAMRLSAKHNEPEAVALARIVIGYSTEDLSFADRSYGSAIATTMGALSSLFDRWRNEGVAIKGRSEMLADTFLGLFEHVSLFRQATGCEAIASPSEAELQERVDFFLRGAGISG